MDISARLNQIFGKLSPLFTFEVGDGHKSAKFYEKCDRLEGILVVIRQGSLVFGGYNPIFWRQGFPHSVAVRHAFLFCYEERSAGSTRPRVWFPRKGAISVLQLGQKGPHFGVRALHLDLDQIENSYAREDHVFQMEDPMIPANFDWAAARLEFYHAQSFCDLDHQPLSLGSRIFHRQRTYYYKPKGHNCYLYERSEDLGSDSRRAHGPPDQWVCHETMLRKLQLLTSPE